MNSQAVPQPEPPTDLFAAIDPILGYLNYGNGSFDVNFFKNLNDAFRLLGAEPETDANSGQATASQSAAFDQQSQPLIQPNESSSTDETNASVDATDYKPSPIALASDAHPLAGCTALTFRDQLTKRLNDLSESNSAFRKSSQSRFAIEVTFDVLLPKYVKFHRDLFFHQTNEILLNSFFVGRAFELVLREIKLQELDSEESFTTTDRVLFSRSVLRQLNDFTGHRPVATLESQKHEAYANERFRPVPLYIQGAVSYTHLTLPTKA